MNKFEVIGRLIKDPEIRYTESNKKVVSFTIAINNSKDDSTFIKITTFNGTADLIEKYTKKGDLIYIDGMIRNNNYEDKEGKKHYEYVFIANKVEFLSRVKEENKVVNKETKKDNSEDQVYIDFGNSIDNIETPF
jgi:single-strand DNA-binding protein